jgi:predicted nucleotide-binding protein
MAKAPHKIPKIAATENRLTDKQRTYVSQTDIPSFSLSKALRIATAIADNYGKAPTKPLRVAQALEMTPTSGPFRMLCGASIAYGLTEGGYNADTISLTALARRIVAPTDEGDDAKAKRETTLKPRIIREFLTKYNNSKLPTEQMALNVLEEMGAPREKTKQTLTLIMEIAKDMGFLRDVKGSLYVDLEGVVLPTTSVPAELEDARIEDPEGLKITHPTETPIQKLPFAGQIKPPTNRVFITHGKNKEIVAQIKELLTFGNFEPIVSVEHESLSKPVSDKVMDDMRSCSAAIIHVGTELKVLDQDGTEHRILNPNVLIEIGASLALYGGRFILLVEKGVTLPSNLQGLYEVRYEGNALDYAATMKLLKAFNEFKS